MKNTSKWILGATAVAGLLCACDKQAVGTSLVDCQRANNTEAVLASCGAVIDKADTPAADRAFAYVIRSSAWQEKGNPAKAIEDASAAVRLIPKDATALANRGAIYSMQGNLEAGARDLDAAIAMGPVSSFMLGNRAIIHDKSGEWAEGHAVIKRAVKIDPESKPAWGELCWNGAAGSPDPAGALPDCDKAIELFPSPNNFNSRGMANYRAGKYVEAITDYDRSIEGDPGVGSSWYMRGLAKQAAGVEGAQVDIDKGVELEPGVRERYVRVGILPP